MTVETVKAGGGHMTLKVTNPTIYPADVTIYAETTADARKTPLPADVTGMKTVSLQPGASAEVNL